MKLTAGQVFDATQLITQIIRDGRKLPQKGAYRLARMHKALLPEFSTISEKRDEIINSYDHKNEAGVGAVPEDKGAEFFAKWKEIADQEIEVNVEPIPLDQLDLGKDVPGAIAAAELIVLGDLVRE